MVDTLYLDGRVLKSDTSYHVSSTQVIALVAGFCQKLPIQLRIVIPDKDTKDTSKYGGSGGFKIPYERFHGTMELLYHSEVPHEVSSCDLPVLVKSCQNYYICGLCHIMRYLVKSGAELDSSIMKLLGYKYSCFKSSSEVSSRTYLCEVAASNFLNTELARTGKVDDIPQVIRDFEDLLSKPIVIHNMDKQQRKILSKTAEYQKKLQALQAQISPGENVRKVVVDTKDLPVLNHVFADGVDFMLSDVSLIPVVHMFIERYSPDVLEKIPLIVEWYQRVADVPGVKEAVEACSICFTNLREPTMEVIEPPSKKFKIYKKEGDYTLLEYKQGKRQPKVKPVKPLTIKRDLKSVLEKIGEEAEFDKYEQSALDLSWADFPPQVNPVTGELTTLRAQRKCGQIENLVQGVRSVMSAITSSSITIVEFCSGGGHVGIVLAYLLPHCRVVLLDNKEESLNRAHARVQALKLDNIDIYQCNLGCYQSSFDVGVALHACGVATDMVLEKCLQHNASFVLAPCCYGKIQKTDTISYPQSVKFRNKELTYDELVLVGQAGDMTCWEFDKPQAIQGKKCMGLVDMDRCSAAQEKGYRTTLATMQPAKCTPKNNMIIGKSCR